MDENKPNKNTQNRNLICDWTDERKYLIHYRMLKFYIKQGMTVDKVHEIIPFKQSKWLKKFLNNNKN